MTSFMKDFSRRLQAFKRGRCKLEAAVSAKRAALTPLEASEILHRLKQLEGECESLRSSIAWDD